jgi:uncharacterized protein GlcG (DUF336 family)
MTISRTTAESLVESAMAYAEAEGLAVSVAVTDQAGFLKAFARADGASPLTVEVAQGKAYAVTFMGRTSEEVLELAEARPQFFDAIKGLGARTVIPSPGGMPVPGGAIGVSGATNPRQDVDVALAAIAALEKAPGQ